MDGRNPAEAVNDFLAFVQAAVSCVGSAKVTVSPGGRGAGRHVWALNRGNGMRLRARNGDGFTLKMTMHYSVDHQPGGRWRVATEAYYPRRTRRPDVRLHRAELCGTEWELVDGLPATRPARIAADLLREHRDLDHIAHVAVDAGPQRRPPAGRGKV